jgi:hypothetical protein
MSLYL